MTETIVDARGLKCPWPALRLAKAMRGANHVRISADDPQAPAEFRALCREHGWSILAEATDFIIKRPLEAKS
ncbi:sulfurtransferase TusA family protein [Sphingomonas sp. BIUV-7]|uniref:Sulfurtransferase TusA family protein n=1 Tax=Sphingomonas natans TaxID=3063330 RepID=A0ABT8Y9Y4_9SPHN|nr:sulfurtransferase TusA family protein [Sphingomonas sp. BIUV-7]MDO6415141.1 sulfurtransferase TusA family protein [Sphingomonas sp. BIUV-7]